MGKVVAIEHLTLDGVMQGPGRADEDTRDGFQYGGWGAAANDPVMMEVLGARMGKSWSLLVGRTTYEDLAGFWRKQPRPNPIAESLDAVEKVVVSTTLVEPLPWPRSTLLKGDAANAVAELKKARDETLVIFGSGMLVQALMRRDLIDEYVLPIHPLVLGKGRRLFPEGSPMTKLRLVESVATRNGVVVATYRPEDGER